jgi:hypothetical protein
MRRCAAVQRKGSADPCEVMAVRGHTLCGRHARMKHPVLWSDANQPIVPPVVRIQACVRRWLIQKRLSYAGPGVLCRAHLANEEDIVTCAPASRVHPMNFVSFEENGKVWWFEFGSLWTWCMRNRIPLNPYTNVPLSSDTRKRLRSIWGYMRRHKIDLPPESSVFEDRLRHRFHVMTQHFADYGFEGVSVESLMQCSKLHYVSLFGILRRDAESVLPAGSPFRTRIATLCDHRTQSANSISSQAYILQSVGLLLHMLSLYRDPYVLTFSILSAFHRV